MRLDSHIHIGLDKSAYSGVLPGMQEKLMGDLKLAGMDGGLIISCGPDRYSDWTPQQRLEDVMNTCEGQETLFPFYWIDPLEEGALSQVDMAVAAGVSGFKMSCSRYQPDDRRCLDLLEKIAQQGKPVLFHSGICWDGVPSANNHRPGNFEALLDIPKLRFALAHISWPWCDECIAVYGKFNNAYWRNPGVSCEMFVDVTPGTPRPWREEVFKHLKYSEYEFKYNLMFGTDSCTDNYNISWSREWQERDDALYAKYFGEDLEDFQDHVYHKNLLRFLGIGEETVVRKIPKVGQ